MRLNYKQNIFEVSSSLYKHFYFDTLVYKYYVHDENKTASSIYKHILQRKQTKTINWLQK